MRFLINYFVMIFVCLLFLCGCGTNGLRSLSGTATYDDKPIPYGSIMFEPDTEKGNSGSGGAADIVNGHYKTRKNGGVGTGAYRVTIYGFDSALNTNKSMDADVSMFYPYVIEINITPETKTWDFNVPKGGGSNNVRKNNIF
jgi:hypothetical protein